MKHLRILDPNHAPRDGHPYTDPDTGYVCKGKSIPALIEVVKKHRESNELPISDDIAWQVETALCKSLPPDECVFRDGTPPDLSCHHRGERLRVETCIACGGSIKAIIEFCGIHGECTQFKRDVGVKQCSTCPDRVSKMVD